MNHDDIYKYFHQWSGSVKVSLYPYFEMDSTRNDANPPNLAISGNGSRTLYLLS